MAENSHTTRRASRLESDLKPLAVLCLNIAKMRKSWEKMKWFSILTCTAECWIMCAVCSLSIPNHISFSTHHLVLRVDLSDFNNGNSAALSTHPRSQCLVCVLFYYGNFSKHVLSFEFQLEGSDALCLSANFRRRFSPYPFQHTKQLTPSFHMHTQYFNHFNIRIHETKSFLPINCLIKNHFQLNFSAAISLLSSYSICNSTSPLKHNNFFFLSFLTLENLAGSMSELYSSLDADFTAWNSTRMRNKCFPADVPLLQHHDIGISYG